MDFLSPDELPEGFWLFALIAFLLLSAFLLLGAFSCSAQFKGAYGEALVWLAAKLRLPAKTYHPLHNVTLPTPDGTTQIDHIFVSCFGIFVVETKHMSGRIYGGELQSRWTQKFSRKSFQFQNPLRQNYKHLKAVKAVIDLPLAEIRSVVVFTGSASLMSPMPANVTLGTGLVAYIKSFQNPVLTAAEVANAVAQIEASRLAPSRKVHRQHIQHLNTRSDPTAQRKCPRCGSPMVLRTAKRGANTGKKFWGCSAYPRCKCVQDIT